MLNLTISTTIDSTDSDLLQIKFLGKFCPFLVTLFNSSLTLKRKSCLPGNCCVKEMFTRINSEASLQTQTLNKMDLLRVKLVFEYDFEISWSFGPLDLQTLGLLGFWSSSLLNHLLILSLTSSYLFLLLLPTTSCTLLPPSFFSYFLLVWFGIV